MKTASRYAITVLVVVIVAITIPPPSGYTAGLNLAVARSTDQIQSLQPNGQSLIHPQKVSTSTTPQVEWTGPDLDVDLPPPEGHASVLSPQNVVRIPVPADPPLVRHIQFEGEAEHGWQPSDSNGVGGVSNYVEAVNEHWAIYSRSGMRLFGTTFAAWFRFPTGTSLFDPVVQWDKIGQRFIFIVSSGSSLLLSVAQQSSALGQYCNYTIALPSGYFGDYEKLGVSADGIYFSVNLYKNKLFVSNELFFVNRTQLETCTALAPTIWRGLKNPDGSMAFAIVPARQDSNSNGIEYLVNSYPLGGCKLTLWKLTSSGLLSNSTVNTQCYSPPPAAKQKGSVGTLDVGDNRLYQANFLDGLLTLNTVGSYNFGDGNGSVGIVEWFVLDTRTGSVFRQGAFGAPGYWLFYPATIRNSAGNMLFVYAVSGKMLYPSIWYSNQTLSDVHVLASGESYYGTKRPARWGDYSSAWLDSASPNSVWITAQYAKRTNFWGTRVGLVTP